jgi:hypothetical protein
MVSVRAASRLMSVGSRTIQRRRAVARCGFSPSPQRAPDGTATALFPTIFSGGVYANYAVSNDGQRFLVSVPPAIEDAPPITVVINRVRQLVG